MSYEKIISELNSWSREECFYREYYLAKKAGKSVEGLLADPDISMEHKEYVLNPASIDPNKTEEEFFQMGRNLSMVKHPRYFPYFTHRHAFFEMIYVLSGHCRETTGQDSVELSEGDLFLLAPEVLHGIEVLDDSIVLNILIRQSTFLDIFLNTVRDKSQIALFFLGNLYDKERIRYLIYHSAVDETLRNDILDMYLEQSISDEFSDRIMCSQLTIFFSQLTRHHGKSVEIANRQSSRSEYSDQMLQYIIEHFRDLTLQELADHFHFSVPYCSRVIREISGIPFSELITRIRLQQGENLLSHTQMSVAAVGERIGYKNPETFIRAFLRVYHKSPAQYRKSLTDIR